VSFCLLRDKVPVTIEFEDAGKATISLDVQGVGAQGPVGDFEYGRMKKMNGHSGTKM